MQVIADSSASPANVPHRPGRGALAVGVGPALLILPSLLAHWTGAAACAVAFVASRIGASKR